MAKFIEVTDIAGTKRLINLAWVEEIWHTEGGTTNIYFAFSCPNAVEQDWLQVKESYEEIKAMIDGILQIKFQPYGYGRAKHGNDNS